MGKHSNHTNFAPKGIFEDCHSMNHQTLMGVAEAIKDYTEKGFICFIPLPDAQCDVDFIAYHPKNHDIVKVQCKTTCCQTKTGKYAVGLKDGHYANTETEQGYQRVKVPVDYDELFALSASGNTEVWTSSELKGYKHSIQMK